jgi:predicted acyltransferase
MANDSATLPAPGIPSSRIASVDAYRGLVMFLMMAEVWSFGRVSEASPGNPFWAFLDFCQSHVPWVGCSLHDMIQPSFTFLVGVALPFSIASRRGRGQSAFKMTAHAFWRAFILIMLGIFLRSIGKHQTYFTFEDTLTQIGLGYGFLFILGFRSMRDQWIALGVILVGYWAAFVCYPLPGANFDYAGVGVPSDWLAKNELTGLAAHWNKNSNLAWAFDTWFLNLFPRERPFVFNNGGYATLSFIPTLGTMILGLLAGGVFRSERTVWAKVRWFAIAGVLLLASGWLLGWLGICPVVKRIWTPSWVLFSGGWCFLILALFYMVVDIGQRRGWAFPLMVIGMNSIAAYCMAETTRNFTGDALRCHFGRLLPMLTECLGLSYKPYESLVIGSCILAIQWLILYWMYRKKLFLRV